MNQDFVVEEVHRQDGGHVHYPQDGYAKYKLPLTFKQVFVTSTTHDGNLGGIAGADKICNDCASAAGLEGTFKAWLGDSDSGPVDNFVMDRWVMYILVNGEYVGMWPDLIDAGVIGTPKDLLNPISMTEFGDMVTGYVWSNVYQGKSLDSEVGPNKSDQTSCQNWSSPSDGTGNVGSASSADGIIWSWDIFYGTVGCSTELRLYCFEQ
jgi:hypothetical protein